MMICKKHSMTRRIEAVVSFLVSGNSIAVGKQLGIPSRTIRDWMLQPWWNAEMERQRARHEEELDVHLGRIINKAFSEAEDRLDNGDEVFDPKAGNIVRRRMSGKDAALIGAMSYDKRALVRNRPTQIMAFDTEKRLHDLRKRFAEVAREEFALPANTDSAD